MEPGAKRTDPNFPVESRFLRKGFDPDRPPNASAFPLALTPFKRHPQVVNQNYLTSWNNKQAKGYHAADEQWSYGDVYRSITLDERVKALFKGKRKATLPQLIDTMKGASTVDLRGHTVLPYALKILASKPIADPAVRNAVDALGAWTASGAHRLDSDHNGSYEHSDAILIMDSWWTPLLHAEFEPALGKSLFDQIAGINILDDSPSIHQGSAYNGGWYVYANKDLRQLLAKRKLAKKRKRLIRHGKVRRARKLHLKGIRGPNSRGASTAAAGRSAAAGPPCSRACRPRSARTPIRPRARIAPSATTRCATTRSASGPPAASPSRTWSG